jgi:CelD/BcsL family acetyltransferase involved in cellulose biosynthesis
MITVAEHFDLPALDRLRDLWRDLWWKTPNASFFQSFEAFDRLCTHARPGERPCVFVVSVSGRPVGLAPWVEKTVRGRLGRLRVLTDGDAGLSLSRGPLGTNPRLTLEAVTEYTERHRRWDGIELRHVEIGHSDDAQSNRRFDPAESQGTLEDSRVLIECRGDWVRYLRALPAHIRERYQDSERLFETKGRLECLRYRPEGSSLHDDDPRWDLFGEIEQAERQLGNEFERQDLLHDLHKTAASIAGIDMNLLRLDGRLIAWSYNYRCDGRIEVERLRGAGEFAIAAERVLLGRMLCDGFRRGDESYLFDRQASQTAAGWRTGRANRYRRVQYPRQGARLVRAMAGAFTR